MRKRNTVAAKLGAAALTAAMTATTAFGGTWQVENESWRYRSDSGSPEVSGWVQDGGDYYRTDENGYMKMGWFQDNADGGRWYYLNPQQGGPQGAMRTGWVQDQGMWYFLDPRIGGPRGAMLTGWQWIDGRCYYLDPARGGAMAVSCTTPDGYRVGADGAWLDDSGNPYFEAGKGISSTAAVDITGQGGLAAGKTGAGGGAGSGKAGSSTSSGTGAIYSDAEWDNYSDNSVSYAVNSFEDGNYGMMDSGEREEVEDAIDAFQERCITSDMSDFEKEIMIIKWLVANCSYEKGDGWENATAYSCIVNGKAQCSGYADAFLQTAKACGLKVRYVHNKYHAWNLVKLDGDWYHVDVTWEDPVGSNGYGFSKLRNKYINLEDSSIRNVSSHHTWSPDSTRAKGAAYGPKVVAQYLKDGAIDTSKGQSFKEQMDQFYKNVANEDGSNMIEFTGTEAAVDKICAYLGQEINSRKSSFSFVIRYPAKYDASETGSYSLLADINRTVQEKVISRMNAEYQDILRYPFRMFLLLEKDADSRYYVHDTGNLSYQEGKGKMVDYLIHFVDTDGNEIGAQSGTGEKGRSVQLKFPEGYSWISDSASNYKVNSGKASYSGKTFHILSGDAIDMNVRLQVKKAVKDETKDQVKDDVKNEGQVASPHSAQRG